MCDTSSHNVRKWVQRRRLTVLLTAWVSQCSEMTDCAQATLGAPCPGGAALLYQNCVSSVPKVLAQCCLGPVVDHIPIPEFSSQDGTKLPHKLPWCCLQPGLHCASRYQGWGQSLPSPPVTPPCLLPSLSLWVAFLGLFETASPR